MQKSNSIVTIHDHEENMELNFQLNRWILKPIGAWPKSVDLLWIEKLMYFLINVICIGLISFLFIPCAVFMVIEENDTYHILKLIGHLIFLVMVFVKYFAMIFRENDIRRCIEEIKEDWITIRHCDDRTTMIRNAKFSRRLVIFSAFFMYSSALFYYFVLPFKLKITEETQDGNLTYRPMTYPVAKMIIDVRYSPANEIFFWVQCMSGIVAHAISAGACSVATMFAMHAYGRLKVLALWIDHLVDGREDFCGSMDERLMIIVQQHIRILRFITLTDKVLSEIAFVEIGGCTINICLCGYYVMMEWEDKTSILIYISLALSLVYNVFIFCYIGELVTQQCKKIGEVSYMTDWYRLPEKKGLALILINAMSNSSVQLTVANIELSINTFSSVINTSVAYLNMLRALTM